MPSTAHRFAQLNPNILFSYQWENLEIVDVLQETNLCLALLFESRHVVLDWSHKFLPVWPRAWWLKWHHLRIPPFKYNAAEGWEEW